MSLFIRHSREDHTLFLAQHLPRGPIFSGGFIPDTKLYDLLYGLAESPRRAEDGLQTVYEEYDFNTTTLFIDEWESAVGIPDDCFDGTGTIEQRRVAVQAKMLARGAQTGQDFIDIANLFGVTITVLPGMQRQIDSPGFFATDKIARFTMIVLFSGIDVETFTYTFPLPFGNETIGLLECFFRMIAPSNVDVLFEQV